METATFNKCRSGRASAYTYGLVLTASLLACLAISYYYVSAEKFIYSWDFAGYENQTCVLSSTKEPTLKFVLRTIGLDYNYIPALGPLPFVSLFGQGRMQFILGMSVMYLWPFSITIGLIVQRLFPSSRTIAFIAGMSLSILTPVFIALMLRGYPDVGGIAIFNLAIVAHLSFMEKPDGYRRTALLSVTAGALLALTFLFRRHLAYASLAFLAACLIQIAAISLKHGIKAGRYWYLYITGVGIGVILISSTLGLQFVKNAISVNHSILYSSYKVGIEVLARNYRHILGYGGWALAFMGFVLTYLTSESSNVRRHIGFLITLGLIWICLWLYAAGYAGWHQSLPLMNIVIVGLAAMSVWLFNKNRLAFAALCALYIVPNAVQGLTNINLSNNPIATKLLAAKIAPLYRPDMDQIRSLTALLHQSAEPPDGVLVIGSSVVFNDDILRYAETLFFPEGKRMNFLSAAHIDSRDFLPLENVIKAAYLVVGMPAQYHMAPDEQKVVKAGVDIFADRWEIANDFTRFGGEFTLQNNIKVQVYKRLKPTDAAVAVRTLTRMSEVVGRIPGSQAPWISIAGSSPMTIMQKQIELHSFNAGSNAIVSSSAVTGDIRVAGDVRFNGKNCAGLSLDFYLVDQAGRPMSDPVSLTRLPSDRMRGVSASLGRSDANAYVMADLTPVPAPHAGCRIDISHLSVSNANHQ